MTVRDLYLLTLDDASIIVKDAADVSVYFSGRFLDIPFKYMNYIIYQIRAIGNTLVVSVYN